MMSIYFNAKIYSTGFCYTKEDGTARMKSAWKEPNIWRCHRFHIRMHLFASIWVFVQYLQNSRPPGITRAMEHGKNNSARQTITVHGEAHIKSLICIVCEFSHMQCHTYTPSASSQNSTDSYHPPPLNSICILCMNNALYRGR